MEEDGFKLVKSKRSRKVHKIKTQVIENQVADLSAKEIEDFVR